MACATGALHTIALSDDGVVHSFGQNEDGQLGLSHLTKVTVPTCIPNIPQIKQIACGWTFTMCVDNEGFMWTFGHNKNCAFLNKKTGFNIPHKIQDIPLVLAVGCGYGHTLIITDNLDLWSYGYNDYGQLSLGNQEDQSSFQKTSFSNISKISIGSFHSLFQDIQEDIFVCGCNDFGQLGLGHSDYQITPILIPNLPPNIVQFFGGYYRHFFLDSEGKVFSVGYNRFGQLGLGHNINQNVFVNIPNIPPILSISCVLHSSYLVDLEGNVWSFGNNIHGQLGHGDVNDKNSPTKIERLNDIQQISYGPCGYHFLAKDSQNRIFATGSNDFGQLGTGDTITALFPEDINSQYFSIWGEVLKSKAKSARK